MRDPRSLTLTVVTPVAFLSGAASLVYQINWQRDLSLVFGVSHYATTTVVLGFFLGFALGAELARRLVDRGLGPFAIMAGLEAVVAAYAWAAPSIFEGVKALTTVIAPPGQASLLSVTLVRAVLSTLAVAVPTICMGATIPVFLKASVQRAELRGAHAGLIGSINTAGAVMGSLLTTFVLMGNVSGTRQVHLASALNLLACALSLWQHRQTPAPVAATSPTAGAPFHPDRRLLAAYALSGAAGLGLELVWNRIVFMSLDHTIFTFALTLTVYLVGYALGSLLAGLALRRATVTRNTVAALMVTSLVTAVLGFRFYWGGLAVEVLPHRWGYFPAATLVVMAFLFVPTLFMGLGMPLVLHLVSRDLEHLGADTGRAQLLNNLGSVAAILVVGFVLIPLTNTYATIVFCLSLLSVGVLLLLELPPLVGARGVLLRLGSVVVVAAPVLLVPLSIHQGHVRNTYSHAIDLREDPSGLWGLDEPRDDLWVLRLNGYYENHLPLPPRGSIQGDFLIPAMVKPKLGAVYMVGLGLGVGAYELLKLPDVTTFDAAELSPVAVALARRAWSSSGQTFFSDPRFHVIQEDGRAFLEHSTRQYDVVISGTNRIFYAGSTHLYSVEYWQTVKQHLAPEGVFLQWLPTYSMDSTLSLLKSFREVFPDVVVLRYTSYVYLLGFRDGVPRDLAAVVAQSYARAPAVFAETALPTPERFAQTLMQVGDSFAAMPVPTNHDDLPVCEYSFRGFEEERGQPMDELLTRRILIPSQPRPAAP